MVLLSQEEFAHTAILKTTPQIIKLRGATVKLLNQKEESLGYKHIALSEFTKILPHQLD